MAHLWEDVDDIDEKMSGFDDDDSILTGVDEESGQEESSDSEDDVADEPAVGQTTNLAAMIPSKISSVPPTQASAPVSHDGADRSPPMTKEDLTPSRVSACLT